MLMGFQPTGGEVLKVFQAVGVSGCRYCRFWFGVRVLGLE